MNLSGRNLYKMIYLSHSLSWKDIVRQKIPFTDKIF